MALMPKRVKHRKEQRGRVKGNAMIWLSPSNKKLIDRGSRLIAQLTGSSYEKACIALHQAIEDTNILSEKKEAPPSTVALAIDRLQNKQ